MKTLIAIVFLTAFSLLTSCSEDSSTNNSNSPIQTDPDSIVKLLFPLNGHNFVSGDTIKLAWSRSHQTAFHVYYTSEFPFTFQNYYTEDTTITLWNIIPGETGTIYWKIEAGSSYVYFSDTNYFYINH